MVDDSTLHRRRLLKMAGVGLGAGLAGCQGDDDGGGNDGSGPTEFAYLDRDETPVEGYPGPFNESQDQYKANGRVVGDRYEDVVTQIRAGETPGDAIGVDVIQLGRFENLDALADIESFVNELEYRDDFLGGLDPLFFEFNDKTIAVPFWIDASLYYYNKNHFEEAGLDPESPPVTWAEFEEAAAALDGVNSDYPPIGMSFSGGLTEFFWWPWVWANGGKVITDDGQEARIQEQPAVEALEYWVNLNDQGYTTDLIGTEWPDFHSLFAGENTSIMFSSPYGISHIQDNNEEMYNNEEFGTALFPKPSDGEHSSFLGGNALSIVKDTPKPDAAREFLRWVNSEEGLKATQEVGYLPGRATGFEIGSFTEEPYATYIEQLQEALDEGTTLIHPKYEAISQRIRPAVERALTGDQSPADALSEAANKIDNEVLN